MKTNLGDAKSQQGQKYCWSYFSDPLLNFLIRPELSHVAPPYDSFIENAHEKSSLNLQLSTPCKDLAPHLTRDFEM